MSNYFPIHSDRSEYNRASHDRQGHMQFDVEHLHPMNRSFNKKNTNVRNNSILKENFFLNLENVGPQFSGSAVEALHRGSWKSNVNPPDSNIPDQKISNVLERLTILEGEVFKIKDKNRDKSPRFKEREMLDLKEFYNLIREHKKIQAQINEDYFQEVQGMKKSIRGIKDYVQSALDKLCDKKDKKKDKIFTFQDLQDFNANSRKRPEGSQKICELQKQIADLNTNIEAMKQNLIDNLHEQRSNNLKAYYHQGSKAEGNKNIFTVRSQQIISKRHRGRNQPEHPAITINQMVYLVDEDGYLLDEQQHYLLNGRNQMIKLKETELAAIRDKCNWMP